MKHFPDYWPIQYSAAFHYMEEIGEPERAAELLKKAHKNGGPEWFLGLAGKLYTKAGQKALAIGALKSYIERTPEEAQKKKAKERLKKLQTEP